MANCCVSVFFWRRVLSRILIYIYEIATHDALSLPPRLRGLALVVVPTENPIQPFSAQRNALLH